MSFDWRKARYGLRDVVFRSLWFPIIIGVVGGQLVGWMTIRQSVVDPSALEAHLAWIELVALEELLDGINEILEDSASSSISDESGSGTTGGDGNPADGSGTADAEGEDDGVSGEPLPPQLVFSSAPPLTPLAMAGEASAVDTQSLWIAIGVLSMVGLLAVFIYHGSVGPTADRSEGDSDRGEKVSTMTDNASPSHVAAGYVVTRLLSTDLKQRVADVDVDEGGRVRVITSQVGDPQSLALDISRWPEVFVVDHTTLALYVGSDRVELVLL